MKKLLLPVFALAATSTALYADTYELIHSVSQIEDGAYVIAAENAFGMGAFNGSNFYAKADITLNADQTEIVDKGDAVEYLITRRDDGTFAISHDGGYVSWSGSGNSAAEVVFPAGDEDYNLAIHPEARYTISDTTVADVAKLVFRNAGTPARILSYNASSPRFAHYGNANQKMLNLYRKVSGGDTPAPDPELPAYTSIGAMKEAATATKVKSSFTFTNLLVTFVSGANTYVTDGTEGFLFYSASPFKAGDRISGTVTGDLYLYNGLTEMASADYSAVSVLSSGNAVTPRVVTIADVNNGVKAYESLLITLEGVNFLDTKLTSRNVKVADDSDNELTVRDNFGVIATLTFDTTVPYNVTALVANYKGAAQIYPRTADDVVRADGSETPEPELPKYTTIAALKDAATTGKVDITYEFTDLLVTFTDGSRNLYLSDGSEAILVYGTTGGYAAGDRLTGTLKCTLTQYNKLTELASPDFTGVTVTSTGNAVPVQTLTAAELLVAPKRYESVLVKVDGLTFAAEGLSNKNVNVTDEAGNKLVVRDNFGVIATTVFDTSAQYSVTGLVTIYNTATQLYPRTADDIVPEGGSSLTSPRADLTDGAVIYNILGQRTHDMSKPGIYVVGGKKVLVK